MSVENYINQVNNTGYIKNYLDSDHSLISTFDLASNNVSLSDLPSNVVFKKSEYQEDIYSILNWIKQVNLYLTVTNVLPSDVKRNTNKSSNVYHSNNSINTFDFNVRYNKGWIMSQYWLEVLLS